jgi:DNA-binding CsgD family transcriptional regulator
VEVLRCVAAGRTNREISEDLFISLNTVSYHLRNIFNKTGAANRTEAASFAHRHGLFADLREGWIAKLLFWVVCAKSKRVRPKHLPHACDLQIQFVNQCRGLQRVAGALASQEHGGQAAQFAVYHIGKLLQGIAIPFAPSHQTCGNVRDCFRGPGAHRLSLANLPQHLSPGGGGFEPRNTFVGVRRKCSRTKSHWRINPMFQTTRFFRPLLKSGRLLSLILLAAASFGTSTLSAQTVCCFVPNYRQPVPNYRQPGPNARWRYNINGMIYRVDDSLFVWQQNPYGPWVVVGHIVATPDGYIATMYAAGRRYRAIPAQ